MADNNKIVLFYANVGIDYWPKEFTDKDKFGEDYGDAGYNRLFSFVERDQPRDPLLKVDFKKQPPQENYQCHQNNKFYLRYNNQILDKVSEEMKEVDLLVLSEFCSNLVSRLGLQSYHLQNYGTPQLLKARESNKDLDRHTKSFLVGSKDKKFVIEPVWEDRFLEKRDNNKYFYNDHNIRKNADRYYGCVQLVRVKTPGRAANSILLVNLHVRFKKRDQLFSFLDELIENHNKERNIIILADTNSFQFGDDKALEEEVVLDKLKKEGFRKFGLGAIYDKNRECQYKPRKNRHLRVYFKLRDWWLKELIATKCELNLYTSSHISYKLVLNKKKKKFVLKKS